MERYTVDRLVSGARFNRYTWGTGRSFNAVVLDNEAKRPMDREVAVAPFTEAVRIADALNDVNIVERANG